MGSYFQFVWNGRGGLGAGTVGGGGGGGALVHCKNSGKGFI